MPSSRSKRSLRLPPSPDGAGHAPIFILDALRSSDKARVPNFNDWELSSGKQCYFTLIGWIFNHVDLQGRTRVTSERTAALQALCFRWMTLPRTIEEMEAILTDSCTCPDSSLYENDIHATGYREFERDSHRSTPGHLFIELCCRLVSFMFDGTKRSQRVPMSSERSIWPRSMYDILPHGVENTTRALIAWTVVARQRGPGISLGTELMGCIMQWFNATKDLTGPWIVSSKTLARHLADTLRITLRVTSTAHDDEVTMVYTNGRRHIHYILRYTELLWRIISTSVDCHARTFIAHYPRDLVACCEKALRFLGSFDNHRKHPIPDLEIALRRAHSQVIETGGAIYEVFPSAREYSIELSGKLNDVFVQAMWSKSYAPNVPTAAAITWARVDDHLRKQGRLIACGNYRCRISTLDAYSEGKLRTCGHCRRANYCSQQCQRQAWDAGPLPHRNVCEDLRVVHEQLFTSKSMTRSRLNRINSMHEPLKRVLTLLQVQAECELVYPYSQSEDKWITKTFGNP